MMMRRLPSIEDEMAGWVTYEIDGKYVRLDARQVQEHGAHELLRFCGYGDKLPTNRSDVIQRGRTIGTLPPDFDPAFVKSRTFLYDPRPGDFKRDGDKWIAAPSLGPGDFAAIPGFVRAA